MKWLTLRNEFCIKLTGEVRVRPESQVNKDMATGEVEILAKGLEIINRSDVLPLDFNQRTQRATSEVPLPESTSSRNERPYQATC